MYGTVIVSFFFTFSICTLMMLNMLFTNVRMLKLRFFCYSQDSGGLSIKYCEFMKNCVRTANTVNILLDK